MIKEYTSLGLMSGTSADGIDASIIQSDGDTNYKVIKDEFFEYSKEIYQNIHNLKGKIHNINDLKNFDKEIVNLEREITLFNSRVIKEISENQKIDIVGFHGQTIYHNSQEKISKQLGDGNLLSQLTKKNIVYNFRQNDIKNDGEGAPLTPIFHQLLVTQYKIDLPVCILNIGGISNITIVDKPTGSFGFTSRDIGPGNCMIDTWVRKNSKQSFDKDGILASKGIRNEIIYEQGEELLFNRYNQNASSLDVNDFDISFARGLSLEDGATTLTDLTSNIIGVTLSSLLLKIKKKFSKVLICGGGRKNHILIDKIKENSSKDITFLPIDNYGVNGDFVESQAFAFLAIRSKLNLPISFPDTTGCKSPSVGGIMIEY